MKHQLLLLLFLLSIQYAAFSQKTTYEKALQKMELENYEGAITDLDKVTQADSTNAEAFFKRGFCHAMLREHKDALIDFNRAIFMDAEQAEWFLERGIAKLNLREMEGACSDWKTAANMGYTPADDLISEYCP